MQAILQLVLPVFAWVSMAAAQGTANDGPTRRDVLGEWRGAILRDGAPLIVDVSITENDAGGLTIVRSVPEWLWYPPAEEAASLTPTGIAITDFFRGPATLSFDPDHRQLVGTTGAPEAGMTVHLKKAPPQPDGEALPRREVSFRSADGTRIDGTIVYPRGNGPFAGMVWIRGRGCNYRSERRAEFFARYGIAVLSHDRRGAGTSEGDCAAHTFETLVDDVAAATATLAADPRVDGARVGLRGASLGAWVAQGVLARAQAGAAIPEPAFIVTWVGPATSILEQQVGGAIAIAEQVGLPDGAGERAAEAARIAADRSLSDAETFRRLDAIRREAEEQGWAKDWFAPDDLPTSPETVDEIFLRRFSFDPAPVLARLTDTPYLAIFGEEDAVVPLRENLAALDAVRAAGGDLTVVTVPGHGHGSELGDRRATLLNGETYFKFDTVEPAFPIETIRFLRDKGFATR